ncbi:MAG: universal stress protein [Thermoplasmata archaeon]|nr:MAG: universal stress protein [Thermoplasmata archaeon]
MFRKILIPTDGRGLEDHVIKYVACTFPLAKFYVISVVETKVRGIHLTTILQKKLEENAMEAIEHAAKILLKEGIEVEEKKILYGDPPAKIISYAEKNDISLIAFRCFHTHIPSLKLGGTIEKVLKKTQIPVLIMGCEIEGGMLKSILIPTDGTHGSQNAENLAIHLAVSFGAKLTALYVAKGKEDERGDAVLKNIKWKGKQRDVEVATLLKQGDPAEEILKEAPKHSILIMGAGRKGLLRNMVLGHVSREVAPLSPIPLILMRGRYKI